MRLLDTDVMIDILRDYAPAIEWLSSLQDEEAPGLPGFVVMELVQGERWCRSSGRKSSRHISEFCS
jgi:predicted nucleic acid-binding protein